MHVSRADHSPVNGTAAIPWRSSKRNASLLEHLRSCQNAWCPVAPWDREQAHSALCGTPAGSFVVVRDGLTSLPRLLCVSAQGEDEAVLDYKITCTGTVFQLSESCLSFSDLAQLVFFYSLSRDVLALCLKIPRWISNVAELTKDCLSQLQPKAWLSTPPDQMSDDGNQLEPNPIMCSIQLTSTNGALCVINPLYLLEHGDDWLTHQATSVQCTTQPPHYRRERRLSSTRTWAGAGLRSKRAISLDHEAVFGSTECSGLVRAKSEETPPSSSMSATQGGVVLRRSSQSSTSSLSNRGSTGSLPPSTTELQNRGSPGPQSPHRVSWIEDGFWLPPPTRPSSSLHPPSPELDSLSISSIEEEQEHRPPSPMSHHPSAHRLADKVINRLSAVGQALGSLVCQKRRLTNRVLELSDRKRGPFATAVKEFVEVTLQRGTDPGGFTGSEFLQEVRSLLTSLRETLLDYPDIQALLDSMTDLSDSEIDPLVEISVHKVALKPVSAHLYSCIHIWRTNDGILQRLEHNQHVLEDNGVEALGGASGVGVPDSVTLERIQQRWTSMHEAYSPNKKVHILLKVCKSIYHSMSANASSDVVLGADDFLPCLTWVLLRSELLSLQIDTDYMMELLDPTQLQGEGGYYLTTLYAALYYISSFQPRLAARQLSVEAQHSLSQWHRRRTLHSNQSRHSKRRQTIRRHACPEKAVQVGEEDTGEVGGSVMEEQQTEMNTDEMVDSEQAGWAGR
ncbi:ras and Rab interactor 2 isoform X2 [Dunckerocampus dactyliophorus]|uniref:ras and Rab interactor 2 isoform X2 n=1 Tax=Dunckerocampus dactyliophorus TaxID=161453 RepID=UPI002406C596|nr:ras and Rab interactor 2 isoform X2 [Dunckerocampus dactyliophorus]